MKVVVAVARAPGPRMLALPWRLGPARLVVGGSLLLAVVVVVAARQLGLQVACCNSSCIRIGSKKKNKVRGECLYTP